MLARFILAGLALVMSTGAARAEGGTLVIVGGGLDPANADYATGVVSSLVRMAVLDTDPRARLDEAMQILQRLQAEGRLVWMQPGQSLRHQHIGHGLRRTRQLMTGQVQQADAAFHLRLNQG